MLVNLDSKRKAHALARLRAEVAPHVARWARQGLVADAEREVSALVERVSGSASLWALARERRISPSLLGCVLGILVEARQAELLEGRSRREIRSAWRVDPADVEAMVATLERLAASPGTEEVRALFRFDAQKYASLASSMRGRDDLPHGPGRRITAAGVIESELELMLGDRPQIERRAWAARLVSDFVGACTTARRVGANQRARAAARQRRRAPGGARNI